VSEHVIPNASKLSGWRRSSYSGSEGGSCVETLSGWRKSSRSGPEGDSCIEILEGYPSGVPIRDSKIPHAPALVFTPGGWSSFVAALKSGSFQ
jgi:hypothetical protein